MPMVHPTTGKTINSYMRLMNDPATAETWLMAFGKDFGGMVQGDNKSVQRVQIPFLSWLTTTLRESPKTRR